MTRMERNFFLKIVSVIASCILALLKHPNELKKAQDEIDSVIPYGDLPTFDDRERLPFVTAICMEAMRWRDATPIGIPYATFLSTI